MPNTESGSQYQQFEIPTYYDQPALKPTHYGWMVSGYIFVAGVAGSAQIIATVAEMTDGGMNTRIVRNGRYIALGGAVVGAGLLIADLHTPTRFYNMLRIFRPTSPMSIGSYVLTTFGAFSALLAAAQLRRDLGAEPGILDRAAWIAQIPAALTGAAISTYTGPLLAATSTPLWAALPKLLPAVFGASAMASAAAALLLTTPGGAEREPLRRIELVASTVEIAILVLIPTKLRIEGVRTTIGIGPVLAAACVPLIEYGAQTVAGRASRAPRFGTLAAAAVLGGAFLLRHLVLQSGNRSAKRPRDHFRFSWPR
ncbi:MAG: NrfD/PsrC family molybdoenzyme membrane anchor subunit [Alphaproteobacteria bacterium]